MKPLKTNNVIYLVVWSLLFAAPLLTLYVLALNDANTAFNWTEVHALWWKLVPYLVMFLVHNYLLAPLLVHRHMFVTYILIMAIAIVAFSYITGENDVFAVVSLILMFCINLGVEAYLSGRKARRWLADYERENQRQQLEHLRYSIFPRFFMNTLNDIHALVDTNPEKAKDTIEKLSKMMHYVTNECNKQYVHLYYELDFIRHYVWLMQMRYADKMKITLEMPLVPNHQIPPLIFFAFIENAFRCAISVQHDSFVEIRASVDDDKLSFVCRNSQTASGETENDACIANVRKRLDLFYDQYYSLRIEDTSTVCSVELAITIKS